MLIRRAWVIVVLVLVAGCGGLGAPTVTPPGTQTPTATLEPTATPTPTPNPVPIPSVCPPLPEARSPTELAPRLVAAERGWSRIESQSFDDRYTAVYQSPDGSLFFVEIYEHRSGQPALKRARRYRNDTNFQASMVAGRYTWAVSVYEKNRSSLTLKADGAREPATTLLASVRYDSRGDGLGRECAEKLITFTPPRTPQTIHLQPTPTGTPPTTAATTPTGTEA